MRIFLLISLIFLASCTGSHTTENTQSTPSRLTAANSKVFTGDGYTFRYPSSATLENNNLMGATFMIYLGSDSDPSVRENINLMIQKPQTGMRNLEEFKEVSEKQLDVFIPDADLKESTIKKDSRGESYVSMHYTGSFGKFKLEWRQRAYLKNNQFYLLTFVEKKGSDAEKDDALLDGLEFKK